MESAARESIQLSVLFNGPQAAFFRFDLASARAALARVRAAVPTRSEGETVDFVLQDSEAKTDSVISFSLPVDLFFGETAEGRPPVSASLFPSFFTYYSEAFSRPDDERRFRLDQGLFQKELRSLDTVTFASFETQISSDLHALGRHHSNVAHDPAMYRILARVYYTLVLGTLSDGAREAMATPRRLLGDTQGPLSERRDDKP